MVNTNEYDGNPRLDIERFIEVYRWVNDNLPDSVGSRFDSFLDDIATVYPDDVAAVYEALARDQDRRFRAMAASGLHHVIRMDSARGAELAARLVDDADPGVAEQARETMRDLPSLLAESEGPAGGPSS